MNSNVLTQTIVTGSDPRGLPEFSAIREEINKASHPSQPELNWKLVESLALAIFKANGVDLHTATYYTLARTAKWHLNRSQFGIRIDHDLASIS
ncbi:type VI secretion system ImpA family N-terminal domain-containing protein, partial [Escherichia coli]